MYGEGFDTDFDSNNITTHGSDLDWAVCALHAIFLLGIIGWTYVTNPRRRIFHYFAISILLITTIYYFIIASNLGGKGVPVEFRADGLVDRTRQVFYARWVGYFINFSLAWFALLLLSGVGWASILFTIGLVMLWATMFLIGMFVHTTYKWGFFVFAIVLYAFIGWQTLGNARSYATRFDAGTLSTFTILAGWQLFFMLLYPISWGLSEGGNRISNDSEQIFYSILDVATQGVFSLLLIFLTRSLDFDYLGLGFTEYGRVHDTTTTRNAVHDEKRSHGAGVAPGNTAPATTAAPAVAAGEGV
jgi:bacteriorhodopsin